MSVEHIIFAWAAAQAAARDDLHEQQHLKRSERKLVLETIDSQSALQTHARMRLKRMFQGLLGLR